MTKWINTYQTGSAYSGDTDNFSFPHVGFIVDNEQVKYDKDPSSLGYNIWGTVKDGVTSASLKINGNNYATRIKDGYFMYNWTGGTVTTLNDFCYPAWNLGDRFKSVDKIGLDTQNVTNFSNMFELCNNMEKINLEGISTESATNMHGMFSSCYKLKSIDVSGFNTSGVTNMGFMFNRCYVLQSLDLSSFDTSNVTDMTYMFALCTGLTSINLSSFNTSGITSMEQLFYGCYSLQSLDLSSFNTSGVTSMREMFAGCSAMTTLDLSGWDMTNVATPQPQYSIFKQCNALTSITANNTNQTTLEKIQADLVTSSIASNVTITRDGFNWVYSGGQWVSTPI